MIPRSPMSAAAESSPRETLAFVALLAGGVIVPAGIWLARSGSRARAAFLRAESRPVFSPPEARCADRCRVAASPSGART